MPIDPLFDVNVIYDEFCPPGEAFLIDSLFDHAVLLANIDPKPWWHRALNWIEKHVAWPVNVWADRWDERFAARYNDRKLPQPNPINVLGKTLTYADIDAAYRSVMVGDAIIGHRSNWIGTGPRGV